MYSVEKCMDIIRGWAALYISTWSDVVLCVVISAVTPGVTKQEEESIVAQKIELSLQRRKTVNSSHLFAFICLWVP